MIPLNAPRRHSLRQWWNCTMNNCMVHWDASVVLIATLELAQVSCPRCWLNAPRWASVSLHHQCFARENSVNEEKKCFKCELTDRQVGTCPKGLFHHEFYINFFSQPSSLFMHLLLHSQCNFLFIIPFFLTNRMHTHWRNEANLRCFMSFLNFKILYLKKEDFFLL